MASSPKTQYAKSGDVHIAFQVVGEGSVDLVVVPGWVSNIEYAWEEPWLSAFLQRLSSFSRLILLDRRGTGLSDRVVDLPTLEQRMDDVRAVMDAVGSARAALFGLSEAGPMCLMFAATYPQRTAALVLYGTWARFTRAPDYPIGMPSDALRGFLELIEKLWGTGFSADVFAPSMAGNERFRESWARLERLGVSPASAQKLISLMFQTDARDILPVIRVPTLLVHRVGDRVTRVDGARYMAERIPGVKYVELPGDDHIPWVGDVEAVLGEVEEFLTGVRRGREADRVLATILFADIVSSTEKAAALGDRRWRELLDSYYALARRELVRFRGREIDTAGDGLFAAFDGPARGIRCAAAITAGVRPLGIEIRAGLHTGECEVVGEKVSGIAVHIGARVASHARAGEVLVSSTVKDLVAGSGLQFEDREAHSLKGVPGEWRLFAVRADG
ncbi:MAG TPA: adenylate/guanylate cyclase domain-containing protein [Methylomirabilota bacterium]|nr:adenylate/guanylate cyclase domain-containing protein [Methylomirabilota bacterium]